MSKWEKPKKERVPKLISQNSMILCWFREVGEMSKWEKPKKERVPKLISQNSKF